jgi:hypothetical protein
MEIESGGKQNTLAEMKESIAYLERTCEEYLQ